MEDQVNFTISRIVIYNKNVGVTALNLPHS